MAEFLDQNTDARFEFDINEVWKTSSGAYCFVDKSRMYWITLEAEDLAKMAHIKLGLAHSPQPHLGLRRGPKRKSSSA